MSVSTKENNINIFRDVLNPQKRFLKKSKQNYKVIIGKGSKSETNFIIPLITQGTSKKLFDDNGNYFKSQQDQDNQQQREYSAQVSSYNRMIDLNKNDIFLKSQKSIPTFNQISQYNRISTEYSAFNTNNQNNNNTQNNYSTTNNNKNNNNCKNNSSNNFLTTTNSKDNNSLILLKSNSSGFFQNKQNSQDNLLKNTLKSRGQLVSDEVLQNQQKYRDSVGEIWEKNKSFQCRSPPLRNEIFMNTESTPRKTNRYVNNGGFYQNSSSFYNMQQQDQLLNIHESLSLEQTNKSIQKCNYHERSVQQQKMLGKNLKKNQSITEKKKNSISNKSLNLVNKNKLQLLQSEPNFTQKLVTRPLGRTNIYLQKAIYPSSSEIITQNVHNEYQQNNDKDARTFGQKGSYFPGLRSDYQMKQMLEQSLQINNPDQQQEYNNQYQQNYTTQQSDFSTAKQQHLEKERLAQRQSQMIKPEDWQKLAFSNLLNDHKRQSVTDLNKIDDSMNESGIDSQDEMSNSQQSQNQQTKKKVNKGLFGKLARKIKRKKKAEALELAKWNGASKDFNKLELQKSKQMYNTLFEPDTSKKKRKSYYQELQAKKEGQRQWNTRQNPDHNPYQAPINALQEKEDAKKRKSYYEQLAQQKKPLQWKATDKRAEKEFIREVTYIKPPTPEIKRKSYFQKIEKGPVWNIKKEEAKVINKLQRSGSNNSVRSISSKKLIEQKNSEQSEQQLE